MKASFFSKKQSKLSKQLIILRKHGKAESCSHACRRLFIFASDFSERLKLFRESKINPAGSWENICFSVVPDGVCRSALFEHGSILIFRDSLLRDRPPTPGSPETKPETFLVWFYMFAVSLFRHDYGKECLAG
ncbi:hypothetical protein CDAR_424961 [Caerostris darwini]|uniref:Uncharacterized protein n=1 Tax=Caerostris darwini TaxID=1538125 RepID=A0AAV4UZV3_9ARAC|nr:hypothetical protein CDAR_424961 [Caerostris darwini]